MDDIDEMFFKKDTEEEIVEKQRVMLDIEKQSKLILSDENKKKLFVNFFDIYAKDEFNDIAFLMNCERQMLISMYGLYFIQSERNGDSLYPHNFCSNNYFPFVKLLIKNGILQSTDEVDEDENRYERYYNYLLITVCLRFISQEFFANSFKELYGGFFPDIENSSIDNCIGAYFSIDFIVHHDTLNIFQFAYFMSEYNKEISDTCSNFEEMTFLIMRKLTDYLESKEQNAFEYQILNHGTQKNGEIEYNPYDNVTIELVDQMDGIEFERYVSYLFEKMGYSVVITPASGDQGIDIIVAKNGIRLGVQAKRYISTVTNTAIQEVVAGIKHYNLQKGIVVTNNNFTKSAIELAKSNDVILWDRNKLYEIIQTVKSINNLF